MKRPGTIQKLLAAPLIGLIFLYRYLLSPLLPRGCRHYPSCSVYGIEALKAFGPFRGGILTANRILRCQPWGTSGYDPVPKILVKKSKYGASLFGMGLKYPAGNRLKDQ